MYYNVASNSLYKNSLWSLEGASVPYEKKLLVTVYIGFPRNSRLIHRHFISFHFILNSLYRVKSTITIDLQAALLKT